MLKQGWEGNILYSGFKSNAHGVAILLKQNFEYKILGEYSDNSGNLIVVDLKIESNTLKVVNMYAPNTDSPAFFENILDIINKNHCLWRL